MHGASAADYDDLLYYCAPEPLIQPRQLAAAAAVFGFAAPSPQKARILEIGCGTGLNAVPMAYELPEAEIFAFDYSPRQIEEAKAYASSVGLSNLKFEVGDIREVGKSVGEFDYIIAHGIYSWVAGEVRNALLQLCHDHLAPSGIALIDYNTNPGWHMFQPVRDMMLFCGRNLKSFSERAKAGKAFVDFAAAHQFFPAKAYAQGVLEYQAVLAGQQLGSVAHDVGEPVNDPILFYDFAMHAREAGLDVLGDAELMVPIPAELAPAVSQKLDELTRDWFEFEQYMDFLRGREFRRTMLVRNENVPTHRPDMKTLTGLFFSCRARPQSLSPDLVSNRMETFATQHGVTLNTSDPRTKLILGILAAEEPNVFSFDELVTAVRGQVGGSGTPSETEIQGFLTFVFRAVSAGLVYVHAYQPRVATRVTERPMASAVARAEIRRGGGSVTTLLQGSVDCDGLMRELLPRLDGTRDRAALLAEMGEGLGSSLDGSLAQCVRAGLLVQ